MPITARKLVYDFERKLNSLNSFQGQSYQVVDSINTLNEAWEIVFENNVKLAEVDSRYRNNLRQLEKKNIKLDVKKVDENTYFAEYPADMHTRLGHYANVSCKEKDCPCKMIVPRITQTDDIHRNRLDPYRRADYGWEQLPMDEAGNGLYLYTDKEMEICDIYIDYFRKIKRMEAPSLVECAPGGYKDYDENDILKDVFFDVDSTYLARKVVDVAVLIASRDTKDYEGFNTQLQKILTTENLT